MEERQQNPQIELFSTLVNVLTRHFPDDKDAGLLQSQLVNVVKYVTDLENSVNELKNEIKAIKKREKKFTLRTEIDSLIRNTNVQNQYIQKHTAQIFTIQNEVGKINARRSQMKYQIEELKREVAELRSSVDAIAEETGLDLESEHKEASNIQSEHKEASNIQSEHKEASNIQSEHKEASNIQSEQKEEESSGACDAKEPSEQNKSEANENEEGKAETDGVPRDTEESIEEIKEKLIAAEKETEIQKEDIAEQKGKLESLVINLGEQQKVLDDLKDDLETTKAALAKLEDERLEDKTQLEDILNQISQIEPGAARMANQTQDDDMLEIMDMLKQQGENIEILTKQIEAITVVQERHSCLLEDDDAEYGSVLNERLSSASKEPSESGSKKSHGKKKRKAKN